MKQILTFVAIMLTMLLQAFSQVPHTFSYQAIVRDAESNVVAERQVIVKVQILQGSDDGAIVYTEIQNVKTNKNGLITFELGGGVSNDDFSSIDWSNAPHFVKTTTNVNGRLIMAVAPILAVPYALYAEKAGITDVDLSEYAKKADIPKPVDLSNYALISQIPEPVDLTGYAKSADVASVYAVKSDLNNYALISQIPKTVDLSIYEKTDDVASTYAKKAEMNNYYSKAEVDAILEAYLSQLGLDCGHVDAKFSVSPNKQVYFSKGNLQYHAIKNTWRFAENQWDVIGTYNDNASKNYNGWIDLFGYGTSGYNNQYPYLTSTNEDIYKSGKENGIAGTNYDWGVYNRINNAIGQWRTLTKEECDYLITRKSGQLCCLGTVKQIPGVILLPDNWTGVSQITNTQSVQDFTTNSFSVDEWAVMQSYGAVFLPCAGERDGTKTISTTNFYYYTGSWAGHYWLSSTTDSDHTVFLGFSEYSSYYVRTFSSKGYYHKGFSVRLVRDVE